MSAGGAGGFSQQQQHQQLREIISEVTYQENLNKIIQRDFFPDVPNLEQHLTLQDAGYAGDIERAISFRRAKRQSIDNEMVATKRQNMNGYSRPLHEETLSGFHARATNEYNIEFDNLQKQEAKEQNQKLLLMSNTSSVSSRAEERSPLLASDVYREPPYRSGPKTAELQSSLFFLPKSLAEQANNMNTKESRVKVSGTRDTDRLLMPPPLTRQRNAMTKIVPSATRFSPIRHETLTQITQGNSQQEYHLEGDDATSIATRTTDCFSTTTKSTDLDSPALPLHIEIAQGRKRRLRELTTMIPMSPRDKSLDNDSWLHVDVRVKLSDDSELREVRQKVLDVSAPLYQLPLLSSREKAANHALAKLEQERKRKKLSRKTLSSSSPPSIVDTKKVAKLTPAAQALWMRTSGTKPESALSGSNFASALRSSYSRSSAQSAKKLISSSRRSRRHLESNGPKIAGMPIRNHVEGSESLTPNGRLKLPV